MKDDKITFTRYTHDYENRKYFIDPDGVWVRYSDVKKMIEKLEEWKADLREGVNKLKCYFE